MTQPIVLYAAYDKDGDAVTGLTVTVNVYRVTRASGASSQIVTGGSATEIGSGLYLYAIASADLQTYDYLGAFATVGDVTSANVWSVYPALANAYATELANLDAAVSTRLPTASYTAPTTPPTTAAIADAVMDEEVSAGVTARQALAAAGSAADPMLNAPDGYGSNTLGGIIASMNPAQVTIVSPVATDGTSITVIRGDDYLLTDNRALTFTGSTWPTLTAGTVALKVNFAGVILTYSGTITAGQSCYVALTKTDTAGMATGTFDYDLEATLSNASVVTLVQGKLLVQADVR